MEEPKIDGKKTILIIEDDKDVLSMMFKHLTYGGYNVVTADNGMDGLKLLEMQEFSLVITDIVMPYVSGVGVIATLKKAHPNVPVIAMTGFGEEPERMALENNVDMAIAKPIKISLLRRHIEELIGRND